MKHPLETIECQLRHILGHLVHTGYSIASLKQAERDVLGVYHTLHDHIERCEAAARPVSGQPLQKSQGGLLAGLNVPLEDMF